jgi:hypothetical protein
LKLTPDAQSRAGGTWPSAFQLFKYIIFMTLLGNFFFYLAEDITAYLYLDPSASFAEFLGAFAATIDYVAWIILIVLFEMETSAHARDSLYGVRRWTIARLTAICYAVLVYAAYGYAADLADTYQFEPIASETICDLAEDKFAYLNSEARPIELTAENCGVFAGEQVYGSPADHLIATHPDLMAIRRLGWVDVANAVAWLLVVLIFQIEISLQQVDKLTKFRLVFCSATKIFLYLVLTGNAIYWTIYSTFIDSWDAWVWLVAFVLIDLNLLGVDDAAGNQKTTQAAQSAEAG